MDIDFSDALHVVYLAKLLDDIGESHIIESYIDYGLDYDTIHMISFAVLELLFEVSANKFIDEEEYEMFSLSNMYLVDYYRLATKYGEIKGLKDSNNPYYVEAEEEARMWFNFSYSLGCRIFIHPKSRRPHKTRMEIYISTQEYVDMCGVAIGVAAMFGFFKDKCEEIRKEIEKCEVMAA